MVLFFWRWKMENGWKMVVFLVDDQRFKENCWKGLLPLPSTLFHDRCLCIWMAGFTNMSLPTFPMIPCQSRKPATPPEKTHTNGSLAESRSFLGFTITQCHPFHPQPRPKASAPWGSPTVHRLIHQQLWRPQPLLQGHADAAHLQLYLRHPVAVKPGGEKTDFNSWIVQES